MTQPRPSLEYAINSLRDLQMAEHFRMSRIDWSAFKNRKEWLASLDAAIEILSAASKGRGEMNRAVIVDYQTCAVCATDREHKCGFLVAQLPLAPSPDEVAERIAIHGGLLPYLISCRENEAMRCRGLIFFSVGTVDRIIERLQRLPVGVRKGNREGCAH